MYQGFRVLTSFQHLSPVLNETRPERVLGHSLQVTYESPPDRGDIHSGHDVKEVLIVPSRDWSTVAAQHQLCDYSSMYVVRIGLWSDGGIRST